jgi:hypothetical protein
MVSRLNGEIVNGSSLVAYSIFCSSTPGGIEMICSKLSRATSRALHPVRGVVSTVVHQLGVRIHSKIEGEKHLLAAALESDKPLVNFAPFSKCEFVLCSGLNNFGIKG